MSSISLRPLFSGFTTILNANIYGPLPEFYRRRERPWVLWGDRQAHIHEVTLTARCEILLFKGRIMKRLGKLWAYGKARVNNWPTRISYALEPRRFISFAMSTRSFRKWLQHKWFRIMSRLHASGFYDNRNNFLMEKHRCAAGHVVVNIVHCVNTIIDF